MGSDSSKMAEETAQQDMKSVLFTRVAEREAQRDMERRAKEMAQREKERMAEEMAQLRKERMADREALRPMKMLDDLIGPDIDPVGDHDVLMAVREAQLRMEMRAERKAQFCMERLMDFSSSVKKVVVSDDEGLVESPDDLRMAVRRAWLHMLRRHSCPCVRFHGPFHLSLDDLIGPDIDPVGDHDDLWVDFDSDVSAVKDFNKLLDDLSATRRLESIESSDFGVPFGINRYSSLPRLLDFGSDVSAGEVLKKISDDLRVEREAQLRKERDRRRKSHSSGIISASVRRKDSQGCTADVKDTPPSPKEKRAERRAQLRRERMPTRSKKSNGADVSKMSDSSIPVPLLPSQGGDEPGAVV